MEDLPEGAYKGYSVIEKNPENYESMLRELCPGLFDQKVSHSLVSLQFLRPLRAVLLITRITFRLIMFR